MKHGFNYILPVTPPLAETASPAAYFSRLLFPEVQFSLRPLFSPYYTQDGRKNAHPTFFRPERARLLMCYFRHKTQPFQEHIDQIKYSYKYSDSKT